MVRAALAVAVSIALLAPAAGRAQPEGTLKRLGKTLLRYTGQEVEVVLSYRFAAANPGEPWLLLVVAVTGRTGKAIEIKREKVFLITPTGERVAMATQKEFAEASGGLRAMLARASINQEPVDYWADRTPQALQLFTLPGEGLAFEAFTVNDRLVAIGPIFFHFPAGVVPGTYRLVLEVQEERVNIPFELGRR